MNNFIILGLHVAVIVVAAASPPGPHTDEGCHFWKDLARNLSHIHQQTSGLLHMQCFDDACAQMKCSGRIQQTILESGINIHLCFGLRLHHCDKPVSMEYYIDVPDYNVSTQGKITHNDTKEMPGPEIAGVKVTLIVYTEMVHINASYIQFGVSSRIRAMKFGMSVWEKEVVILPKTLIDTPPCDTSSSTSRPSFTGPDTCPPPTPPNTTVAPVIVVPAIGNSSVVVPAIVNSKTYNKSCELGVGPCAHSVEVCVQINHKSRNGVCKCIADTTRFSTVTGQCEPLHSTVTAKSPVVTTASNVTTTKPQAKSPVVTTASNVTTTKPQAPAVTQASTGSKKPQTLAIVIGSVVGGIALITIVGVVFVCIGRRRRLNMVRGHHLLADDDDDDDNLVI